MLRASCSGGSKLPGPNGDTSRYLDILDPRRDDLWWLVYGMV
jgi:hypothetical protein